MNKNGKWIRFHGLIWIFILIGTCYFVLDMKMSSNLYLFISIVIILLLNNNTYKESAGFQETADNFPVLKRTLLLNEDESVLSRVAVMLIQNGCVGIEEKLIFGMDNLACAQEIEAFLNDNK